MSINMEVELTRAEVRILAEHWLNVYETLSDKDYDEHGGNVMARVDEYEEMLEELPDEFSPLEQLEGVY